MASANSFRKIVFVLVSGAAIGKILGFVREVLMAQAIGVTFVADSFRAAMTAIILPLAVVQGDTVPAVLIPLAHKWKDEGQITKRFISLSLVLLFFGVLITLGVEIFADRWVGLLVRGFTPDARHLTTSFVRVMALAMPAIVWFICLASIEISAGRTRFISLRAAIQNIAVMLGIIAMLITGQAIAIAWGVTIAFIAVASYATIVMLWEGEISLRDVSLPLAWQSLQSFYHGFKTIAALPFVEQLQMGVERFLASAAAGTVAAIDYARTISDTTFFLISDPIGLAILAHTDHDMKRQDVVLRIRTISQPLLIFAIPASLLLALAAPDIVQVVLARGAFDQKAVLLTSQALSGIGLGLWATTLGYILFRQLNGLHQNGRAIVVLLIAYALNIIFNIAVGQHYGAFGFGLGQSLRSVTLVIGMAIALKCTRMIVVFILQSIPACAIIWFGWEHITSPSSSIRLVLDLLVYTSVIAVSVAIFMPRFYRGVYHYIDG